ncbi:MAG: hypothetical protein BroJett040_02480 [Oligoflexia bacterium]|nr:MAG: hypothetical protein BroJett040_02480 [Oligoflexia bacterium]
MTYDLGVSAGNYGGYSYTELNLGLNWYLARFLNWRNAVFSRFGSQIDSASGLDTSMRLEYRESSDDGDFGIHLFGGPGYRIASKTNSAAFLEGGAIFRFGGFSLGAGVKTFSYAQPGKDINGQELPRQDTNYFLIISGGGAI